MWILLISIFAALTIAFAASKLSRSKPEKASSAGSPPADCCGAHEICDKESLLGNTSREIAYFNDEELDCFRGKNPANYTAGEEEQIREVLLSMQQHEVPEWLESLRNRDIKLPFDVRRQALEILKTSRILDPNTRN